VPWLDVRLTTETIEHLWNVVNESTKKPDPLPAGKRAVNYFLAGNLSKSIYLQESKDKWLYENVLKKCSEHLYFKDWSKYYNVHIVQSALPPVFKLNELWINYQKQHEFNPPHDHAGLYSFVIFMKIPTHWKDQHALPFVANSTVPSASNFQFLLGQQNGLVQKYPVFLSPEDEGRMLFFPAWVSHQVFPFYGTDEERVTISGNIIHET
jgi:hypothetical protein